MSKIALSYFVTYTNKNLTKELLYPGERIVYKNENMKYEDK